MNKGLVIYDLNGVVTDLDKLKYDCWSWLADKISFPFSEKYFHKIMDLDNKTALERILKWCGQRISEAQKQQLLSEWHKRYLGSLDELTEDDIAIGFINYNNKLKAEGMKVAVATPSKHAIRIIDRLGLVLAFDAIADGNMYTDEPNFSVLLNQVIERFQADSKDCTFISSDKQGIEQAQNLGMNVVSFGKDSNPVQGVAAASNWDSLVLRD
ncbi:MAG: HAD hydrolase-like protein [Bacteroidia bacterium]